jgi:hypothetical protein
LSLSRAPRSRSTGASLGRLDRVVLGAKPRVKAGKLAPLFLGERRRIPNEGPQPQLPGALAVRVGDRGIEARQFVRRRVKVLPGPGATRVLLCRRAGAAGLALVGGLRCRYAPDHDDGRLSKNRSDHRPRGGLAACDVGVHE